MAEAAVLVKLGLIVLASSTPHYQGEYKHGPRAVFGGTGRGGAASDWSLSPCFISNAGVWGFAKLVF